MEAIVDEIGGFVYVLSNESMPGIVKIGKSKRHPSQRASELFSSGVATPFKVEFALFCEEFSELETDIHMLLSNHRVNNGREFFKVDVTKASITVMDAYSSMFDFCVTPVDEVIDEFEMVSVCSATGLRRPEVIKAISLISQLEWQGLLLRLVQQSASRKAAMAARIALEAPANV